MVKQREKEIEIIIKLTPRQIKEVYRQLAEKQASRDWLDDPEILEILAKREKQVAKEIKTGKFITLKELQSKLGKDDRLLRRI